MTFVLRIWFMENENFLEREKPFSSHMKKLIFPNCKVHLYLQEIQYKKSNYVRVRKIQEDAFLDKIFRIL